MIEYPSTVIEGSIPGMSLGATVNPGFSPDNCLISKKQ